MRPLRPETALAAALLVSGCAGAQAQPRGEVEAVRAELAQARHETEVLARQVEALSARVDLLTARSGRAAAVAPPAVAAQGAVADQPARSGAGAGAEVPLGLEVVKVGPSMAGAVAGLTVVKLEPPRAEKPRGAAASPAKAPKKAPAVSTAVPLVEPDPARLAALDRPGGGQDLGTAAEAELKAARRKAGLDRAHGLEDFVARYPRHPQAAAALVEAGAAYQDAGRADAACTLSRRAVEEYPAGAAIGDALERLAACESRGGDADAEKKLLTRLVTQFPGTPAAHRAGDRLAAFSGRTGGESPPVGPERSGP